MIELLELKFSRRWQTNKIESDWSNSPRHSFSRQFRSPRKKALNKLVFGNFSGISAITELGRGTKELTCHGTREPGQIY